MPPEGIKNRDPLFFAAGLVLGLAFCALNRQLFLLVNGISIPVLDWLMLSLTHLGNGMVAAMLVLLLSPFRREVTIRAAVAMLVAGLLTSLVKEIVPMPRPASVLGDAVRILGPTLRSQSLPSGHTATAFALACSLRGFVNVRLYRGALVLAVLVGVSRVYIGVHFPLDAALGGLLGWLSVKLTDRYSGRLADRLAGPRPLFEATLLMLAAFCGVYLAFFEPMARYNPWFLRPVGIAGVIVSLVLLFRGRTRGDRRQ